MAIFVIFRVSNVAAMEVAMARAFPGNHLRVDSAEWVVSAVGTPKDVSDKLGVTPGTETGTAMIFSMGSYYGRATTEIWDWIKAKAETPSVT